MQAKFHDIIILFYLSKAATFAGTPFNSLLSRLCQFIAYKKSYVFLIITLYSI